MSTEEINSIFLRKIIDKEISIKLVNEERKKKGIISSFDKEINSITLDSSNGDVDCEKEKNDVKFDDILYAEVYNIFQIKNERKIKEEFEVDSKLKFETKYKDDFETFKKKLEENKILIETELINDESKMRKIEEELIVHEHHYEKFPQFQEWNQFKMNKEKFNVESTYNENKYTTSFDIKEIPEEIRKEAEKIEKSILREKSKHRHIYEERGVHPKNDHENEEFKYSSVYRNNNHYTYCQQKSYFNLKNLIIFLIIVCIITAAFWVRHINIQKEFDEDEEEFYEDDDDAEY